MTEQNKTRWQKVKETFENHLIGVSILSLVAFLGVIALILAIISNGLIVIDRFQKATPTPPVTASPIPTKTPLLVYTPTVTPTSTPFPVPTATPKPTMPPMLSPTRTPAIKPTQMPLSCQFRVKRIVLQDKQGKRLEYDSSTNHPVKLNTTMTISVEVVDSAKCDLWITWQADHGDIQNVDNLTNNYIATQEGGDTITIFIMDRLTGKEEERKVTLHVTP